MDLIGEDLDLRDVRQPNTKPFFQIHSNANNLVIDELGRQKLNAQFNNSHNSHYISGLNWSLNVNTIGQKIQDQKMDFCQSCFLPILIYGRLLPCKHVMCFECATKLTPKTCTKDSCQENVERIEKVVAGRIFVCNYEQENLISKNNFLINPEHSQKDQCGRSYMSQRDLDAHIKHRHQPKCYME